MQRRKSKIDELRMELPVSEPLTLQGPGSGQSAIAAGRFAVDDHGKRFPVLARGKSWRPSIPGRR